MGISSVVQKIVNAATGSSGEIDLMDLAGTDDNAREERLFAKRQQMMATLLESDAVAEGRVAVRHLMSKATVTVPTTATVETVQQHMKTHHLRHVLVRQGKSELAGVISDRDLTRKRGATAADIMTANPLSVTPDTLLSPAVTLMIRKRISCLPVVEEGQLVGVFTTTDLIMALQCAFQLLQRAAPNLTQSAIHGR
jgi:CBS domain-containing protein